MKLWLLINSSLVLTLIFRCLIFPRNFSLMFKLFNLRTRTSSSWQYLIIIFLVADRNSLVTLLYDAKMFDSSGLVISSIKFIYWSLFWFSRFSIRLSMTMYLDLYRDFTLKLLFWSMPSSSFLATIYCLKLMLSSLVVTYRRKLSLLSIRFLNDS